MLKLTQPVANKIIIVDLYDHTISKVSGPIPWRFFRNDDNNQYTQTVKRCNLELIFLECNNDLTCKYGIDGFFQFWIEC